MRSDPRQEKRKGLRQLPSREQLRDGERGDVIRVLVAAGAVAGLITGIVAEGVVARFTEGEAVGALRHAVLIYPVGKGAVEGASAQGIVLPDRNRRVTGGLEVGEDVRLRRLEEMILRAVTQDVHVAASEDGAAGRAALRVLRVRLLKEDAFCGEAISIGRRHEWMVIRGQTLRADSVGEKDDQVRTTRRSNSIAADDRRHALK